MSIVQFTRRIALKGDYHKKRMDMLAYAPVEYNYLETLAKTIIKLARQNHFIQENNFNNAPIRRVAIAMNTNSAFTGSFTENPFWYQQFDLRQIRKLRGGQPIVDFDTADNCQHPYSPIPAFAAFIQYLQLFISSSFDKKSLQEFTMFTYSLL